MIPVIKEGRGFEVEVQPLDGDGNTVSVTGGEYRIDDISSGQNIVPWTQIEELSPPVIKIRPDENLMLDETRRTEERLITVIIYYGLEGRITDEYYYKVKNLRYIPK